MVVNTRDRNIDSSRREDSRKGQIDRCEIINVRPHVQPYPDDKNFNTVDVQLVDRPMQEDGTFATIERIKINCMQREHGLFQGNPWNPRIGDLVLIYWISEKEAMVLCTITSVEQEPICRSQADQNHQEYVHKLSPWRQPIQCADTKNFIIFPPPEHPDCRKWWPKTRDSIIVFDCANGHDRPQCDRCAPCNELDDIIARTWMKNFSDCSPTTTDKPWRYKFHHNSGSVKIYDDDGSIHEENKVSCSTCGGSGLVGTCATCGGTGLVDDELCQACEGTGKNACGTCTKDGAVGKGHTHHYPSGSMDMHAGQPHPNKDFIAVADEDEGVRTVCVHPDDLTVLYAWEAKDFASGAYLCILKNGQVYIYSPAKVTAKSDVEVCLQAPKITLDGNVEITGDLVVDGSLTHGNGPCCADDFVEC